MICFPLAISVFSKCFRIKCSRNLLRSKYNSTMVTFNSCTDTRQISAAPNSRQYLIQLFPFRKMMSFLTNGLRFLVQNCAASCLIRVLPQMYCGMQARSQDLEKGGLFCKSEKSANELDPNFHCS